MLILACLLMVYGTKLIGAEPLTPQEKKQREAEEEKRYEEEEKIREAIGNLGGSAYADCLWVNGLMVIVHKERFSSQHCTGIAP